MKLTINTYYDDKTLEFICSKYYVDGDQVEYEDYMDIVGYLNDANGFDDETENECDCCGSCECGEDYSGYDDYGKCEDIEDGCDCPECTILKYVELIQEINGGCPYCIESVLRDFMINIIDHIIIEDVDENAPELLN